MDSCSDIVAAVGTVRLLSPCGAVAARHPAGREVYAVGEGMRLPDDDAALDTLLAGYVARMTCRDERALEALYDSTLGRVHAMALRIVGRRELAEEVVEDTYFQAWRRAADYDAARGRVLAWLLTICRSRALDALRRADPAEPHEDPAGLSEDVSAEADPLRQLELFRRDSAVRAALAALKPQARQLLALAFFRGLTHQEIAACSGLPLGTVKATLHRACRQLRALLAGEEMEAIDE